MRTTLNFAYLPSENPRGVFIGSSEEGAWGQTLAQNVQPRKRGLAARGPVYLLSVLVPSFWFAAPDFDESALLGQWL